MIKGYKAFKKGLICRGKRYAENTVFEEENAEVCRSGMHFCKNPLDVLDYYPLIDDESNITEFTEVEALDGAETDDGKQFCTKKLKIGSKLNLSQFIKASFDTLSQNINSQVDVEALDNVKLAGGRFATLVGGNNSIAKGKKGSIILLVERNDKMNIVNFKAVQVDGKKIKEDVLYRLKNGELIQV